MTYAKHTNATLQDIAAAAGVSRSTASRALNDSPRISKATKQRIREIARAQGFVPNARGRALATGKSETVAILITEPLNEFFSDPTYGAYVRGITEQLSESSYLPALLQASSEQERARVLRAAERRAFDAIINISPYEGDELLESLTHINIPTVLCGQLAENTYDHVFSSVFSDDYEGARLAAQAIADKNRAHCVAILGPKDNPAVPERVRGYQDVLGSRLDPEAVVYTGWTASDGFIATRQLMQTHPQLDAVLAGSDRIAAGALEALAELGKRVPEDVSVVGFDNHPIATHTTPQLTTVHQPLQEEGVIAAKMALEMIDGSPARTEVLHMSLVERQSH